MQFEAIFRTIGQCILAVVHAIGAVLQAILNGIISLFDIIIGCLTCQGVRGRRRHRTTATV